jgi:5'-nucleotidase
MTRMILNHREQLLGSAINVNVPCLPQGKIKGVVVVRQAQTNIVEYFEKRTDPRENTYYWFAGESSSATRQKDTDVGALTSGFITVTPIHFDLTTHDLLDQLKDALEKNRF